MKKTSVDHTFIFIWMMLLLAGLVMVFSVSSVSSLKLTGNRTMFSLFFKQLLFVGLGVFLALIISNMNYNKWKPYLIWVNVILIILLVLVGFTGLGIEVNGAKRWINIVGFQFQPSEMAKLIIIITVASMLDEARKFNEVNKIKTIGKILLYVVFYGALIGIPQNHASVIMIIVLTVGLMFYFAGINKLLLFGSAIVAFLGGLMVALSSEFRRERVFSFLNPMEDKMGDSFQMVQNWYALGSGGLSGVGLGYGRQKFGWLPENHTDFIMGMIGEELGFLGIVVIMFLFFLLIFRGLFIAMNAKSDFGTLLVAGIIGLITIQVLINTAVISGLFPVTGIPLPFISYGGTYTVTMCMMVGVMLSVQRHSVEEQVL